MQKATIQSMLGLFSNVYFLPYVDKLRGIKKSDEPMVEILHKSISINDKRINGTFTEVNNEI